MSISTDALLVYGYDLGASDDVRIKEANGEYGEVQAPWWNSGSVDMNGEPENVFDAMMRILCVAAHGAAPTWPWQRNDVVHEHYGARMVMHCSDEYPMYILAAHSIIAYRGDVERLDLVKLIDLSARKRWDDKLHTAINVLGIHPQQEKPMWLLVSSWSC